MNSKFQATIGILGGTGPAATAYAFNRLIAICQHDYKAVQDSDFPNIVVTSIPIQGMDEYGFKQTAKVQRSLEQQLQLSSATIKKAGVDIVYMACNTLHGYENVLAAAGLKEVNIIYAAADYAKDKHASSRIAILSSRATRREKLYGNALAQKGLDFHEISDEAQHSVDKLILSAMGGKNLERSSARLKELCDELLQTADYIILGCTELSLVAGQSEIEVARIIDAQEVALRELLRRSV